MSHVTHMNESCHTYEWVMSHIWMSHVTHMNESCHTGLSHRKNTFDKYLILRNIKSTILKWCVCIVVCVLQCVLQCVCCSVCVASSAISNPPTLNDVCVLQCVCCSVCCSVCVASFSISSPPTLSDAFHSVGGTLRFSTRPWEWVQNCEIPRYKSQAIFICQN